LENNVCFLGNCQCCAILCTPDSVRIYIYFLKSNITNLQVALLAVNAATLGIVLTKIREIIDKTGQRAAFDSVRREMLLSIKEQVSLITISLVVLALEAAKSPPIMVPSEIFQALLLASFIYSIFILYDTAKSVFAILDY